MSQQDYILLVIKQFPTSIIMIAGLVMIWLSSKERVNEDIRKRLTSFGWLFTCLGSIPLLIVGYLAFWENLQPYQKNLFFIRDILILFFSPISFFFMGLIGLLLISLHLWHIYQIERGYKIQASPVINIRNDGYGGQNDFQEANIQVENIGKGRIDCAARLTKITRNFLHDTGKQDIDIKVLNPDGRFLSWLGGSGYQKLDDGVPCVLHLIGTELNQKVKFIFLGNERSQPIELGFYTIQVVFFRSKDRKWIKLLTFEETLKVSHGGLEWVKGL